MAEKKDELVEGEVVTTAGKYEPLVKGNAKGKNKRPLISKGKGYEITLNDKK